MYKKNKEKGISQFEKDFFKKVQSHFPLMYKNREYQFSLERFCNTFPKTAEKITNEILKERENTANSRKADN